MNFLLLWWESSQDSDFSKVPLSKGSELMETSEKAEGSREATVEI